MSAREMTKTFLIAPNTSRHSTDMHGAPSGINKNESVCHWLPHINPPKFQKTKNLAEPGSWM